MRVRASGRARGGGGGSRKKCGSGQQERHDVGSVRTADGGLLKLEELVAYETHNKAGLAHGSVAQQHQLEVARFRTSLRGAGREYQRGVVV